MSKYIFFIIFSISLLILGRNLFFLPKIDLRSEEQKTDELKKNTSRFIAKQKGVFSIYYRDLATGEEFGLNENKVLTGASLNKLVIIAYLYHLASDKKIDLEEKVVVQKDDIQDYGTGVLRYEGEGNTYTLKSLAEFSLERSDNTAAHILGVKLGMDNIQNYAKSLRLSGTDMLDNKTTARDMGIILSLIYQRKVTTEALDRELLDFLKDTDQEDRLPRYFKGNVNVYHKTADAINMIHDVGIIDDGKSSFVLAILTSGITDEEDAKTTIGKLAKMIYDLRL